MRKEAIVVLADGFEEIEALTVVDVLRRADTDVKMLAFREGAVRGAHEIRVEPDGVLTGNETPDALILPGGMPGAKHLAEEERVLRLVRAQNESGKILAAICAAPMALDSAGALEGKKYTCYPGFEKDRTGGTHTGASVEHDGHLITGKGPAFAMEFALEIAEALWGAERRTELEQGLLL